MRISTSRRTIAGERPLNPAERSGLILAAATTTLLFYAVTTVVAVVLLAVCTVLLVIFILAARFALGGIISPILSREWQLLKIVIRSLWLREGADYRLKITPSEAPRLFAMVTKLAGRMEVRPPDEVFVEMHAGAWVQLKGVLRGRGKTILGVGYDLLAGLPEHEVEAVLAHEMAHARLVNRGLSKWMNKGLGRLVTMTSSVRAYVQERKQADSRTRFGELLYQMCDALTTRAVRLVATYSRQDEFEADAGAAETCGPASIRWALIHTDRLHHDLERLPWSERVARLETETSFSRWLVGALAHESVKPRDQMRDAVDQYSTHPSLRDRIEAIGADESAAIPGRPGIELLGDPDRIATQLTAEIHRTAAKEERKDDRRLQENIRKIQKPTQSNWYVVVGVILIALATFLLIDSISAQKWDGLLGVGVAGFVGFRMVRAGRQRTRRTLPIPAYGTLTWTQRPDDIGAAETAIEKALRDRLGSGAKPDLDACLDTCMNALAERDYLRAHVASRLALDIAPKSADAALTLAIAAAGIGNAEQSAELQEWVRQAAGWQSPNVKWGIAWARCLMDDYTVCEALLAQLVEKQPNQPTFQGLLGLAKMSRGKMRTAEQHLRKAMTLEPANLAHVQLLAGYYLECGRLRDAMATLSRVHGEAKRSVDFALLFARLELLRQRKDEALQWVATVRGIDADPAWLVRFGFMFENARFDDQAADFFRQALDTGHFPEAHIGLARLRASAGERDVARDHLLRALNAECDCAPAAQSPLRLFHDIVGMLNNLEDRRVQCRAWIATVPQDEAAGALAGRSLFVCAPDHQAAGQHLQRVMSALYPSNQLTANAFSWQEAPVEEQPVRPVAPGVQHVL